MTKFCASNEANASCEEETGGLVHTLISIFPTFAVERMMGLPTSAGKMCSGKLEPAYPHLTNCKRDKQKTAQHRGADEKMQNKVHP